MSWHLEGMQVFGTYMGDFPVSGKVTLSRVAYGGRVHHHIKLDSTINVYGAERDSVILEHSQITRVRDLNREVA
jgi:hypothetical protein